MFEKFVNQFYTEVRKDTNLFDVITDFVLDTKLPIMVIVSYWILLKSSIDMYHYCISKAILAMVFCWLLFTASLDIHYLTIIAIVYLVRKNCFRVLRTFQYPLYHSVSKHKILSYVRLHFRLHNNLSKMQFKEKPFDLK